MPIAHLEDRAVVAVSGAEARSFLQGLVTNDIERLAPGTGLYAALLTPQGKILFDFFLVEGDGAILIDCLAGARDGLIKRLSMYKLRARVTIESRDQLAVLAERGGATARHAIGYPDPRLAGLGSRAVVARAEMQDGLLSAAAYHAHRQALGVPEAADFGSDRMFALDADLDELHAVDFAKGCYVGQELTARMKHRGTARKRLLALTASPVVPPPDTPVTAGGKAIGEIASAHGQQGFALIRLDRLDEAGDAPVSAGSSVVELIRPHWLFS
jgi:folate-binding protein YgfZ